MVAVLALSCGNLDLSGPGSPDGPVGDGPYLGTNVSDAVPVAGGRLVYALPAETNSWNPSLAQWPAYSMQVARALFDTLYSYDADGNIQPNLVEKAEPNADFTQWTTRIRPGIRFHNGKKVTAEDVVKNSDYYRTSPVLGGIYALTHIERAEIIDELTFRFTTSKPWPTMMHQATSQISVVADPEWLTSMDPQAFAKPVGTGPFKLERWDIGKSLTVVRNPDYWQRDQWGNRLPYLERIEFRIIPSDKERATALRKGHIDVLMQTLTTPDIAALREQCRAGELQCFSDVEGETPENFVVLNTSRPPLDDPDARRALALAIDRRDFVQQLTGGLTEPADGMYSSTSPWYTPSRYGAFDPAEAARLVRAVKDRHDGAFRFELTAVNSEEAARITQYLQEAWRKVGIDVTIGSTDNQKKIINQVTGNFQASLTQQFDADHPAAITPYLDPGQTKPGQLSMVFSRLNDPELAMRIEDLLRARPDVSSWRAANARLMDRVNEMVPYIWLDHAPRTIAARPNVVNVVRAALPDGQPAQDFQLGSHGLAQIWIRRR